MRLLDTKEDVAEWLEMIKAVLVIITVSVLCVASGENNEKLTISRHYQGDMFFGHGSTCTEDFCDADGTRFAKPVRRGSCQCQCADSSPIFRDDLRLCIEDIDECLLADYVSGSSTEKIPFVFLPLKGQLIHPDAEIALSDMRSEGQALLSPVCVASKAHFLTTTGWVPIENGSTSEPPFALYREDAKTYLQWLGDGPLRASLDGRLILVRLLCKDTENTRLGVFSPCIGFRVAGSPGVAETVFEGESLDGSPISGSVLAPNNYVAIGITSGVLCLLYVSGVVGFLLYRSKKKTKENRKAKLNSISSPILEDGKVKANPLLMQSPSVGKLRRMDSGSPHNLGLIDQHEAMALFQDAARRHVSPTGIHSPEFTHLSHHLGAGLLPGQVPSIEDDILDAQLFHAGIDPTHLTKEDREMILGHSYMDSSSFEAQSPEFVARIRSAIDSARMKMASRKFFPSLFDIPEEHRDYGSVSQLSQVSRRNSFKAMMTPKAEMKPAGHALLQSSDSGVNGDTSDSSQTKSTTDGSNQPIYAPRRKKIQSKEKEKLYDSLRKNVASTLEKVKHSLANKEEIVEIKLKEEKQKPESVYTNPEIEAIYGSLVPETGIETKIKQGTIAEELDLKPTPPEKGKSEYSKTGKTTFSEVTKQPLYNILKISEKSVETSAEYVMKPAERMYDMVRRSENSSSGVKPVMVEKATYTTMSMIRPKKPLDGNESSVEDILSEAESKMPKLSSDSESETSVKELPKKIWFEPDSLDRPRRAFEVVTQKNFFKNSKSKTDRYEARKKTDPQKNKKVVPKVQTKPDTPETPEPCDSSASTCKSVKSLSRILPGGDELEFGNDIFNMTTGATTLRRMGGHKKDATLESKKGVAKLPISKKSSGELSDASTTSKQEVWDLAGDSNWFAKPSEKIYDSNAGQEDEYSSLESSSTRIAVGDRENLKRNKTTIKIEDSKANYSQSDDYGFEPDTLEKHSARSRHERFLDSLERPELPHSIFQDSRGSGKPPRMRTQPPPFSKARRESDVKNQSFKQREAQSADRGTLTRPDDKKPISQSLEKTHSKSLPSMVDESPALPMKSLRQLFESSEENKPFISANQTPAPPRPTKSIDIQRLNGEIRKPPEQRLHQRQRSVPDLPPKLPPRMGGGLPPCLPPKGTLGRSSSLDELQDYEPIGSVHSGVSGYDDAKSSASSLYDILQRIDDFEREELRPSHVLDDDGQVIESGISKGMEIALQIRAKMLENRNTKSSIKIKLRKFLEKVEDTFSENDGSPPKKGGKPKNFSRSDTLKSATSQASICSVSTIDGSGETSSHKRALAEQSSIHSDTDWHFSAQSTPQNGRRSSDQSDKVSLGSDGTGHASSCSFDTLKTRKSYPMKPAAAADYGFFVNNIYNSDTGKKRGLNSIDSGEFSTGQFDVRNSGLK